MPGKSDQADVLHKRAEGTISPSSISEKVPISKVISVPLAAVQNNSLNGIRKQELQSELCAEGGTSAKFEAVLLSRE